MIIQCFKWLEMNSMNFILITFSLEQTRLLSILSFLQPPSYMSGEVKFRGNFVQKWSKLIKTIKYKLAAKNNKSIIFLAFYEFTPIYINNCTDGKILEFYSYEDFIEYIIHTKIHIKIHKNGCDFIKVFTENKIRDLL